MSKDSSLLSALLDSILSTANEYGHEDDPHEIIKDMSILAYKAKQAISAYDNAPEGGASDEELNRFASYVSLKSLDQPEQKTDQKEGEENDQQWLNIYDTRVIMKMQREYDEMKAEITSLKSQLADKGQGLKELQEENKYFRDLLSREAEWLFRNRKINAAELVIIQKHLKTDTK
jgi:hypothetical protein